MDKNFLLSEEIELKPVLIFDKQHLIGFQISQKIKNEFLPILVSGEKKVEKNQKFVHIYWGKRIPKIPDNLFQAIILIDNGTKDESQLFAASLKEAKKRNIPLAFVSLKKSMNRKILEKITSLYEKAVFLVAGDIVEEQDVFNNVTRLLQQVKKNKQIYLENSGLELCYPVSLDFLTTTVVRELFILKQKNRITYVFPKHGYTMFAMARMLQEIDPFIKVDFAKTKKTKPKLAREQAEGVYVSEPVSQLRKAVEQVLKDKSGNVKFASQKEVREKNAISFFFYPAIIVFLAIVFMIGVFISSFLGGLVFLRLGVFEGLKGEPGKGVEKIAIADNLLQVSEQTLYGAKLFFEKVGIKKLLLLPEQKLITAKEASEGIKYILRAEKIYKEIFIEKKEISKQEFAQANSFFRIGFTLLQRMNDAGDLPEEYRSKISQVKSLGNRLIAISDVLPSILGFEGRKKYLLLLQNNNELRPGGGFIGSYVVIEFDRGRMGELAVRDVYDADGQLKGHVDPPEPLKKYLGLSHWYLRDSNFSVDNLDNAAKAAFFLELETGEKVDGVFTIDASVASGLLDVTGPLRLPGYQYELTSQNFTSVTQGVIEDTFFPGSNEKKNILSAVYMALFSKLEQGVDVEELGEKISDLLAQKHILVAFANSDIQRPISLQGISSTLLDTRTKSRRQVNDFIGLNEANLGVNKVNAFIKRKYQYDINLKDSGEIGEKITLTVSNISGPGQKFGGDYKTYIRFILPKGASPSSLTIDGISQVILQPLETEVAYKMRGEIANNNVEVRREEFSDNSVYGFFVVVPAASTKQIAITSTFPREQLVNESFFTYSLLLFKQPGTLNDPYEFLFSYPEQQYAVLSLPKTLSQQKGEVIQNGNLDTDLVIEFSLSKK